MKALYVLTLLLLPIRACKFPPLTRRYIVLRKIPLAQLILLTGLTTFFVLATCSSGTLRLVRAQINSKVATIPLSLSARSRLAETRTSKGNGKIAFVSNRDNVERIYTINPDGTGLTRLTDGPHQLQPAWSPDGTKIAFMDRLKAATALYLMNADGSNIRLLTTNIFHDVNLAWSPDGAKIAFCSVTPERESDSQFSLHVINADGSNEVQLTSGSGSPTWSPDGKEIALTTFRGIDLMNADGTNRRPLVRLNSWVLNSVAWAPDGKEIMFGSSRASSDQDGDKKLRFSIEVISADGRDGSSARLLGFGHKPSWSPDGSKIVFERTGTGIHFTQIWVMSRNGNNETQLTDSGTNWSPSWQPVIASPN
jgi:Tol biopolymer transport system component